MGSDSVKVGGKKSKAATDTRRKRKDRALPPGRGAGSPIANEFGVYVRGNRTVGLVHRRKNHGLTELDPWQPGKLWTYRVYGI